VPCIGKSRGAYRVLVRMSESRNNLEDIGADRRLILKWIFKQ
jgi:hypothetical protein